MQHAMPSGATVDLRPVSDLKYRDEQVYNAPMRMNVQVSADGRLDVAAAYSQGLADQQRQALLCRLLTGWSYDMPRPVWVGGVENEDSFLDLPLDDWHELRALAEPYIARIGAKPDPKEAITSASNGSSRAKAAPTPRG